MLNRVLPLFLILSVAAHAQSSLDQAMRAQALLGPEVWSRLIVVRNDARESVYPKTVYALVFELAGILWFYTDTDGTQSFSLRYGNLEREKADFAPLLRDIEPRFHSWSEVERPKKMRPWADRDAPLKNGCFVESVVALRERVVRGEPTANPRLLSFQALTAIGWIRHTVLAYEAGDWVEIFDPALPDRGAVFPKSFGDEALTLARALEGNHVVKARYVRLQPDMFFAQLASRIAGAPQSDRMAVQESD